MLGLPQHDAKLCSAVVQPSCLSVYLGVPYLPKPQKMHDPLSLDMS